MNASTRNHEAGSAYIIALMVLVVLSIIGLGLALITQTEMQIGSGERTLQKVFYSADTGIQAAIARAIVDKDLSEYTFVLDDKENLVFGFEQQVTNSAFIPIMNAPCNLCEINDMGEYGHDQYKKVNFGETPIAVRRNEVKPAESLGSKTLSTLVELQPYQLTNESIDPILRNPDAIKKVKF
jgi:Tfp pilus assembly protein PilX